MTNILLKPAFLFTVLLSVVFAARAGVLRAGGIDPEEFSGFAFGFGIDRMALMRHGVDDLRAMYADDLRFMEQF